jgi:hypothetical protein
VVVDDCDQLASAPVPVPAFGNVALPFVVEGYEDDSARGDFHAAIHTFLALGREALDEAGPAVFEYYRHIAELVGDEEGFPRIAGPGDVWNHVAFLHEITVQRDGEGSPVYVSVEAECEWEREHGLQLVFRDGARVTKVGPYDGHLTNASAYARDDLEDVIYVR